MEHQLERARDREERTARGSMTPPPRVSPRTNKVNVEVNVTLSPTKCAPEASLAVSPPAIAAAEGAGLPNAQEQARVTAALPPWAKCLAGYLWAMARDIQHLQGQHNDLSGLLGTLAEQVSGSDSAAALADVQ